MAPPATGQAPYGFRWDDRRLVSNGEEALIRSLIFELFEEHQTKGAVARLLNERGFRTRRRSKWSDVAVSRQLTCSSAIGVYAINKTTTDDSGNRIDRTEEEWDYVECDRLISKDLWNRVQAIFQKQKTSSPPSGKPTRHLFTGVLRCACGKTLALSSASRSYTCPKCSNRIPADDLEDIFCDQLSRLFATRPDLFGDPPSANETISELEERREQLNQSLSGVKREMSKFERLFASDEISLERFSEVHVPLESEREKISKELKDVRSSIERGKKASDSDETLDFRLLIECWHDLSLEDRRSILTSLVDHISIGDGELEFHFAFPENNEDSRKDASSPQQTVSPTNDLHREAGEPLYIRLPAPTMRCPLTGMSRAKLNELILPNERNSFSPPVKSLSIKQPGRTRGTRLIVWASLKSFLAEQTP